MHTTCFSTKTYLNELRRSWDATWRSCRARRVAGVQRMGRQECSLRRSMQGHLDDGGHGHNAFISARHGDPLTHSLSLDPRQHRTYAPRRYLRQTHRPCYQWMDVPPPHANAGRIIPVCGYMTAQRAGTGLDDGWLGRRSFVLL